MVLNASALISLAAMVCYSALLLIGVKQDLRSRVNRSFGVYLLSMIIWSFGSLMIFADLKVLNALFWNRFMLIGSTAMPIAFFGFVQVFLAKEQKRWLYLGYLFYVAIQIANGLGYVIEEAYVSEGLLHNKYGPALVFTSVSWVFFIGHSALDLLIEYRKTKDILYRNRIRYLLLVITVIFTGSLTNATVLQTLPVDIAFNVLSALLIAYAILRHQLLDITVVVRKGLLYSIPTVIIGAGYFLIISLTTRLFHALAGLQIFYLSLIVAVIAAVAAQPLRDRAQHWIDKLFFRERYDSSLMLQRLSGAAASILDLDRLTGMILNEITTTMHVKTAAFLLRQAESRQFVLVAQRGLSQDAQFQLRNGHLVVEWLSSHAAPLTRRNLDVMPQFKALWAEEMEDLSRMEAELFIPVKAKGELVGIFVVGPKLSEETYSQDDQLTLTTLANQTAMTIENARLYWELQGTLDALRKAHDELELRVQERTAALAKANKALQSEIAERKRAEEQIKASLREKEILLQEIHHRVKNNLQVISSLLYLQSTSVKDRQSLEILQDSQNRVRTMALVHEKLYQSEDLAKIGLGDYICSLTNNLFQSYGIHPKVVKLKVSVDEVYLGIDTAIPCGLIVNELVSNCLKHAFPDGREGEIQIELWADGDGRYNLTVSDNGIGFPPDLDFRSTSSLGLQLVNNLTRQLRGTIGLDRTGGTAFKITFAEIP
jgi:two-component sensor histidine kinase/uncharacterized membrane protein